MTTFLMTMGLFFLCFLGIGIGVFFFGRSGVKEGCASKVVLESDERCLSKEAGICPIDDPDGTIKMARKNQINFKH
ncbi:MAG: hypothetical protein HRT90_05620 [Candidatus Margulisbacteria bacterium]|nr:hypothetical protein [Candidatus Margulisiibacteriota bacterium]